MARLVITDNGQLGLSHELGRHWVTIGRASGNAFQILESSVSGQHCEVRVNGDELIIRDLRSTNGTFINGRSVSEGSVKLGGTFRLGEVELKLEPSAGTSHEGPIGQGFGAPVVKGSGPRRKVAVLLVDDSMAFLEAATELFAALGGQSWEVHQASAADGALALLQERKIDLVVLDIAMPMLDGVQLLKLIDQRHPGIKKVMLTGNTAENTRSTCFAHGAELFLEKPTAPDGFRFIFNVLDDLMAWSRQEGFCGTLRHVSLEDVIQIECLSRRSCIIEISSPNARGEIFIESGTIVHAASGVLSGIKALQKLLSLSGGNFHLQNYREPAERTVHGAWEYLLMEAAKVRDEERNACATSDTLLIVKDQPAPPSSEADDATAQLGEDLVVVSTYDGEWKQAGEAN